MSKMKKLLAMLLALAMVLGMSITTMAVDGKPEAENTAIATIQNVEEGADIKVYQIVDAFYDDYGFVKYVRDNGLTEDDLSDIYNPTYDEIMEISKKTLDEYTHLEDGTQAEIVWAYAKGEYTAALEAGMYLVIVVGEGATVYNPMIVSIGYDTTKSGSMNALVPGSVSAEDDWELNDAIVAAKSSDISIDKTIVGGDTRYEVGDTVNYKVETIIPSYSGQYTDVTFKITDTIVNGLAYVTDNNGVIVDPVVTVGGGDPVLKGETTYTVNTATSGKMIIDFADEYILGLAGMSDEARKVVITYSAKITSSAITQAAENNVVLDYTNAPDDEKDTDDTEYAYTFNIDNVLTKTGVGDDANALDGAKFTLYAALKDGESAYTTNDDGEQVLKDGYAVIEIDTVKTAVRVVDTMTTGEDGDIEFKGLDADLTYYVKETEAPAEYSINETVYTITFEVTKENKTEYTYNVLVNGEKETVTVPNTKLVSLPSTGGIGTTMFTIGGCGIMIAAAYLFFASRKREEA